MSTGRGALIDEATAAAVERVFAEELAIAGWARADPTSAVFWRHADVLGTRSIRTAVLDAARRLVGGRAAPI